MFFHKSHGVDSWRNSGPDLRNTPRCGGCTFGHCSLLTESWFTRVLTLERKRTERSRIPFVLMLLDVRKVQAINGAHNELTHSILAAVTAITRETDILGWYKDNDVLGVIFTELSADDTNTLINHLVLRVFHALKETLGEDRSTHVGISCHLFPEERGKKASGKVVDIDLYPDLDRSQKSKWAYRVGKRILDVAGSTLILAAFAPLFLLIALAIKITSNGPVLFRQQRVGQHGKLFTFLKFRSMYVQNNPDIHRDYATRFIKGAVQTAVDGIYKIRNDPRVTAVGDFLRKTSLDEFPQFWNVLKGDMSLVGPRPPLPYEVEAYDIWHWRRVLEAKPGITGLWQVKGRSRTLFDEMVRLDLRYARSSSLWLDVKILLQTPRAVLKGSGAY